MTPQSSEQEAAATLARECTDHATVILWCADRVRSVGDGPAVRDASDYLHDLSTRAQVDTTSAPNRAAIIRECAQQIHSLGGDADVERAAEYLDDLAAEAEEDKGEQRRCGYTKRHPSHTFMRLEVLFQCPGERGENEARIQALIDDEQHDEIHKPGCASQSYPDPGICFCEEQ